MADTKISAAADAGTLTATDMVPLARSGSSTAYHATMAEIATWATTSLPVASTTVPGVVKVDGSTITISSGTISSAAAALTAPLMDGPANAGVAPGYSRGDHVHPNDTSRAPLASPTFTGTPAAPTPTTGDNSTKIATTAFVQAQMVASGAGVSTWNTRAGAVVLQQSDLTALNVYDDAGRNLLHNPTFTVVQRGTGPFNFALPGTSWGYTADRWQGATGATGDSLSISVAAANDANRASIGDEAARSLLNCSVTGGAGANNVIVVVQPIENVQRLAGKTVTVSFYANSGTASFKIGVSLDQSFGTGGSPSGAVSGTGQAVTLSATAGQFQRYSLTFALASVAGKTFGTNGDSATMLNIWLSSGTASASRSGNIGVQSGTVNLWGVQLEIGSVATPLDYGGSPQQQLAQCQRFYQVGSARVVGPSPNTGLVLGFSQPLPVTMRAAPTVTPAWSTQNNCTGAITALDNATLYPAATATFAGAAQVSLLGTFTASADL